MFFAYNVYIKIFCKQIAMLCLDMLHYYYLRAKRLYELWNWTITLFYAAKFYCIMIVIVLKIVFIPSREWGCKKWVNKLSSRVITCNPMFVFNSSGVLSVLYWMFLYNFYYLKSHVLIMPLYDFKFARNLCFITRREAPDPHPPVLQWTVSTDM